MGGTLPLFAVAAVALVITAAAAAAALGLRSPAAYLLSVYLLAAGEIVALTEVLSLFHEARRAGYLIGEAFLLVLAALVWLARGRRRPPLPRVGVAAARRHPLVVALALLVVASLAFQAFLVVATPPNNPDAMSYHLPRAAEWYYRGAVERFPVYDERQNAFPPNAEIQIVWTLAFLERDTLAAAPQFLARIALLLAVYGLARRAGFRRPAAAFATLVCSSLTLIVVQAVTTQTDLVTAAFVASAAYLALEAVLADARAAPLAGLAVGLAVGTKWTGAAAIPALALLVLAATRDPRRLGRLVLWGAAGIAAVGMASYVRNAAAQSSPFGKTSELGGVSTEATPFGLLHTLYRLVLDFADFSSYFKNANEDTSYFGTLGWALILPLCAGFIVAWLLRRTHPVRGALAAAVPILLVELALTHPYNRFEGRLLIGPVALSAALAGWVYARRWIARAVTLLAAVTLVLALVFNEAKPVGAAGSRPVWELSRISAMTIKDADLGAVFSAFDAIVPERARVGGVFADGVFLYPLYGDELGRRILHLPYEEPLAHADLLGLRWVVFSDRDLLDGPRRGWRFTPLGPTWLLAERVSA